MRFARRRRLGWALLLGGGLALVLGGLLAALDRVEIEPLWAFLAVLALTAGLALRARDPALGSRETTALPFPRREGGVGGDGGGGGAGGGGE